MATTTEELGKLLKTKAHARLKHDIYNHALGASILKGKLSEEQIEILKDQATQKTVQTFELEALIEKALFDSNRESYEKREVSDFLKRVDQLNDEIQELKSVQDYEE